MDTNRVIGTKYKTFNYRINYKRKLNNIYDIQFNLLNTEVSAKFISTNQILISSRFRVCIKLNNQKRKKYEMITTEFEEIISIDNLNINNIRNKDIKIDFNEDPILDTSSSYGNYLNVKGEFCCYIYDTGDYYSEQSASYDFVCIASTRWDYIWQRPQQLMKIISENNRVLFFNHSFPVAYKDIKEKLDDPTLWKKRLTKINEKLWVFSTIHLSPTETEYLPSDISYKEFNYKIKNQALHYLLDKLDFVEPIILTNLGESIKYIGDIPDSIICYDCIDDFSSFTWSEEETIILEEELCERSDIIFTTAENLYHKMKQVNDKTYILPNAVDYYHFSQATKNDRVMEELSGLSEPIIGFVGAFYEWIDEELLNFLADENQDWSFVFIGPVQSGEGEEIVERKNVTFLGIKDYDILPDYISQFNVCLIPFKINSITLSANPIKMWEYLATGKPIVSTPIPEVARYEDVIYIGKDKIDFLAKIEEALEEDSKLISIKRMRIAKKNDWSIRVKKLLNIVTNYKEGGE